MEMGRRKKRRREEGRKVLRTWEVNQYMCAIPVIEISNRIMTGNCTLTFQSKFFSGAVMERLYTGFIDTETAVGDGIGGKIIVIIGRGKDVQLG